MAANTSPIYSLAPDIQWGVAITAANTAKDGTGTVNTIFTADATNGGFVQGMRVVPIGTNIATVLRVFLNNGSTNATAANNAYFASITIPASTNSETASIADYYIPLNIALPAGYKINVVLGTAVAAGFICSVVGGKY